MKDIGDLLDAAHEERRRHWQYGEFVGLLSRLLDIPGDRFEAGRRSTEKDLRVEIDAWGARFEIRPRAEYHHEVYVGSPAYRDESAVAVDFRLPSLERWTPRTVSENRRLLHDAMWTWPNACHIAGSSARILRLLNDKALLPNGQHVSEITDQHGQPSTVNSRESPMTPHAHVPSDAVHIDPSQISYDRTKLSLIVANWTPGDDPDAVASAALRWVGQQISVGELELGEVTGVHWTTDGSELRLDVKLGEDRVAIVPLHPEVSPFKG